MKTTKKKLKSIVGKDSCSVFNDVIKNLVKNHSDISDTKSFDIPQALIDRISECNTEQKALLGSIGIKQSLGIADKINTKNDILKYLNTTKDEFLPYKNVRTTKKKSVNAMVWLQAICEIYNQGWTPDWKNHSQYKYLPYRYWDKQTSRWVVAVYYWFSVADCAGGLYFKSRELAEDALLKFRDLYDEYWMI